MKIYFEGTGDESVGINSVGGSFEINMDSANFDEQERDDLREEIGQFIKDFFDDDCRRVFFDDECPDCISKLEEGKCVNKYCINNLYKG